MQSPAFPTSPLAVIHTTIVSSTLVSTVLLLALVFAMLDPVWSRAALAVGAVVFADLLRREALSFRPARVGVYAGLGDAAAERLIAGEPEPPLEASIGLRLAGEAGAAL